MERAFGVLQFRFATVHGSSRSWNVNTMKHIMYACTIMHNMIVEDERDTYDGNFDYDHVNNDISSAEVSNSILFYVHVIYLIFVFLIFMIFLPINEVNELKFKLNQN